MKYPAKQFDKLVQHISTLAKYFDVQSVHACQLHYMIYQQCGQGQDHNKLILTSDNVLTRSAYLDGDTLKWREGTRIIEDDNEFLLYPEGCNDPHIETAVKKAIKQLN